MFRADQDEPPTCIEADFQCACPVEYRMALSPTEKSHPRCDYHWTKRLKLQDDPKQAYPPTPPADWSPNDASEHWDENDY